VVLILLIGCTKEKGSKNVSLNIQKQEKLYQDYKNILIRQNRNNDSTKQLVFHLPPDSLKRNLLFDISYHYLVQNDSVNFRLWNYKTLQISSELNDTTKIAETYWDLASFWYSRNVIDSAYFNYNKAYNYYSIAQNEFQASRMLLSMGIIQGNIKDYLGSEVSTINALRSFIQLNKYKQIYSAYNNLGIINNELGNYDKSIEYHLKALKQDDKLNDKYLRASSFNNLGVVYRNMGMNKKSRIYYSSALETDSLFFKDTNLYAMLIDNLAYSRLKLGDTTMVFKNFRKSLKIRDSINNIAGIIINKLHIAEYYMYSGDIVRAKKELIEAKLLAEKTSSYSDLLTSLLFLAKLDKEKALEYYSDYISVNDSLQIQERLIRNKFARIRFETDQYISENKYLNTRNRNMLWIIIVIISIFSIIYIIRNQKMKYDKLKMSNLQQAANEEIYNLLLISQNNLDEGREKEKKRISMQLHDGILSKFFGVRLNLELLNDGTDLQSIKERKGYIEELKDLESEIRSVSHKLNEDISSLDNNFVKILNELFHEQSKIGNFYFNLEIDETINWEEISNKIKINIYRIIQEGIHNINKYSEADMIKFILKLKKFKLMIVLEDNGVGFDLGSTSDGIGLSNMKSRIGDLSGKIKFYSNKSATIIKMEIPIKNA